MKEASPEYFHKMYGIRRPRISYQKGDFTDYTLMILISAFLIYLAYGSANAMFVVGVVLCAFMIVSFEIRHGSVFRIPLILKRPQDALYAFIYRVRNLMPMYIFALGFLLLENYLIFLTPNLPHNDELMREIAIYLFCSHFILLSGYRTIILIDHLWKKDRVRDILMQTTWKRRISRQPSIVLEILHAYATGMLAHMILITPWWIVITHLKFSMVFLPLVLTVNFITHYKFLKGLNAWFYRDHWLCHNSELEFLYLHGPHHDAIPSGLIGVSGNGYLEGFMRQVLGSPAPFYNPIATVIAYSFEVKGDIDGHQYIPGVFPNVPKAFQEVTQHSMHHFGRLEPYSFGLKVDRPEVPDGTKKLFKLLPYEIRNGIMLDELLTGYKWNNSSFEWYLDFYEKYSK